MKKRLIVGAILIAAIVAVATPLVLRWRTVKLRNLCANQLRQIYAPMSCCVPMEFGLSVGDPLDPKAVGQYIKGASIPRCPCGPEYDIVWKVGGPRPSCPYHGNLIGTEEEHIGTNAPNY